MIKETTMLKCKRSQVTIFVIIALIIVAVVHEFSHGIYMRLFKIKMDILDGSEMSSRKFE